MTHVRTTLAFLSLLGIIGTPLRATEPAAPTKVKFDKQVHDVRLDAQGQFSAQIVSRDGQSQTDQPVMLVQHGQAVATAVSNEQGRIRIAGLGGGQYQLHVAQRVATVRIWTAAAAPPIASQELLIVSDEQVQRAQQPMSDFFCGEPLMIGVLIAAAIAIPIAVHESGS